VEKPKTAPGIDIRMSLRKDRRSLACRGLILMLLVAFALPPAAAAPERVDDSRNYVDVVDILKGGYREHGFTMDEGDELQFHVTVLNGSAVDVLVFIERDFEIYRNAAPGDDLYAEKKLLEVTNITRSYRETGSYGPYENYLVVDNTDITEGAEPVSNVTVKIEAHVVRSEADDSRLFGAMGTIVAVAAAAVVLCAAGRGTPFMRK